MSILSLDVTKKVISTYNDVPYEQVPAGKRFVAVHEIVEDALDYQINMCVNKLKALQQNLGRTTSVNVLSVQEEMSVIKTCIREISSLKEPKEEAYK